MDIFGNFSNLKYDKKKRRVFTKSENDFQYTDPSLEGQSKIEESESRSHFSSTKMIIVIVFLLLASRLFYLQVISASKNQMLADGNSIRPRSILSSRGIITDKNGVWLARNKPSFVLGIYPSDLPKKISERKLEYENLSKISGVSVEDIEKKINSVGINSIELVIIKSDLSREEALLLTEETAGMAGVSVDGKSIREYKSDASLAHIIGYTGLVSEEEIEKNPEYLVNEETGKTGLEKFYQQELRGVPGVEQVEVDSLGKVIQTVLSNNNQNPVQGDSLKLNIDYSLQQVMSTELSNGIVKAGNGANSGVAIAMNPQTGAVIGMVSLPTYDNNIFSGQLNNEAYQKLINDETLPLLNRAALGVYPSGSVIKIVMAAAGLQEGVITKNTSIETPETIKIGEWNFPDWKWHTGVSNVVRAIAESNNIFFYAISGGYDKIKGLGIKKIDEYLSLFGFGSKTGIDLPSEASGLVPNPEWKERVKHESWYLGDTYHVGIGQGDLLITPLQMVVALSAIANGGNVLVPQLVNQILDSDGTIIKTFQTEVKEPAFISAENIKTVQEGMRQTVVIGSGKTLQGLPVSSAAKTGTAQFLNNEKTHAWFEAYAPYENPEIAIVVLVEGGGGGYEIAEPIAFNILQYYFNNKK